MTMVTPCLITEDVVQAIVEIGDKRYPNEACGVLIPEPWRGKRVFEIPNRSKMPRDSFEMTSDDVAMTLEDWVLETNQTSWEVISFWHTHPSGGVGPSKADLDNRIEKCGNLVVSLGEAPKATWY